MVVIRYCLLFFIIPFLGIAQDSNLGNWMLLFGNKQLSEKVNWHHELQYRNYNVAGDLEQLLLRTGVGINISDKANLLQGYGFIRSENYINDTDKAIVNEQRFVEDIFKLRFRYFLSMAFPLWKADETGQELYVTNYNEIFLNTKSDVFDRNRLYGGLGFRLNSSLRFELGYMNQFLNGSNRDQVNIVAFINW